MYEKLGNEVRQPGTVAKIIKVLTYISAALISGFGVFGLIYMIMHNIISSTFFLVFSPIFIMQGMGIFRLFGGIIIAVELKYPLVLEYFDFLQTLLGKGLFYIYISSSVYFFFSCGGYDNAAIAWGCSMTLFGLGLVFVVLHFVASDYTEEIKTELEGGEGSLSL